MRRSRPASDLERSRFEQGILCVFAGGGAVHFRLLKGSMNKRYDGIMYGDDCALLPSLCKADNFLRVIG